MALYVLTCDKCSFVKRYLLPTVDEANVGKHCLKCDGVMRRTPTPPSVHVKEVLHMAHQIKDAERFTDAAELYDARAHQDDRKPK